MCIQRIREAPAKNFAKATLRIVQKGAGSSANAPKIANASVTLYKHPQSKSTPAYKKTQKTNAKGLTTFTGLANNGVYLLKVAKKGCSFPSQDKNLGIPNNKNSVEKTMLLNCRVKAPAKAALGNRIADKESLRSRSVQKSSTQGGKSGGTSTNSAPSHKSANPLAAPKLNAPNNNSQAGGLRIFLRWQSVKGARSYQVTAIGHPGFSKIVRGSSYSLNPAPYKGTKLQWTVRACSQQAGTNCGDFAPARSLYILGEPVELNSPVDNSAYTLADRKPTFAWQPYTGFAHSSASQGAITYTLTLSANGGPAQTFETTNTTLSLPSAINSNFDNPVRWSVRACNAVNCSGSGGTRKINLSAGGTSVRLSGQVSQTYPANGTVVGAGDTLTWVNMVNAATYRICLNTSQSGCRSIYTIAATSGPVQWFPLTDNIINATAFRGRTIFWSVNACTAGNTMCTAQNGAPSVRSVVFQSPSAGNAPGATPAVSWATHLYPLVTGACASCHSGTSASQIWPQKANNKESCSPNNIPFSTSVLAPDMLDRFECQVASSTSNTYNDAYGKTYVVPNNPANSGLHHKAQASSASTFSQVISINGVQKQVKEWITIWIEQGANP